MEVRGIDAGYWMRYHILAIAFEQCRGGSGGDEDVWSGVDISPGEMYAVRSDRVPDFFFLRVFQRISHLTSSSSTQRIIDAVRFRPSYQFSSYTTTQKPCSSLVTSKKQGTAVRRSQVTHIPK